MTDLFLLSGSPSGIWGLIVGIILGGAARRGDLCTLAALETAVLGRDTRRLHLWAVALGVAMLTTHLGQAAGLIDLKRSIYHAIAWNPVASIAGGLLFGYGMAMAGNCGFGALVRAGSGDIRSIVIVVVLGIPRISRSPVPLALCAIWSFRRRPPMAPRGSPSKWGA